MKKKLSKQDCLTVPDLKKRGWTDTLIRDLLGEPDVLQPNPWYRSSPPIRLYRIERVTLAEQSEQWPSLASQAANRKASAARAVETKRKLLLSAIRSLRVMIPARPIETVQQSACDHYNWRQEQRDSWGFEDYQEASLASRPEFLKRITVNYLRHQLTSYERKLDEIYGKVGTREAYCELNRKIYDAISASYPELAEECSRQMAAKEQSYVA